MSICLLTNFTRYFAYRRLHFLDARHSSYTQFIDDLYLLGWLVSLPVINRSLSSRKIRFSAAKRSSLIFIVGDVGMFIGILILFTQYKTFTFDVIYQQVAAG